MAIIRWTAAPNLPQSMPLSTTIAEQSAFTETVMSHGAARRRTHFSTVITFLECPSYGFMFTGPQKDELVRFYRDDIFRGSLGFNWDEPVLDIGDVVCMFASPPEYRLIVPHTTNAARVWGVTMKLYVLPLGHPGFTGFE